MHKKVKVPKATITRLSLYLRQLEILEYNGYQVVSSEKLAWLCRVKPAQVRKDLCYFGEFGIRGVGYDVRDLLGEIKKILSVNRVWNMGIAGIGDLGSSLLQQDIFQARGFHFVAAFDSDLNKIGKAVNGLLIKNIKALNQSVREFGIEIGVITTPPSAAQKTADRFLDARVSALLNFSPTRIHAPETCRVENIDPTIKLDTLAFRLRHELPLCEHQGIGGFALGC